MKRNMIGLGLVLGLLSSSATAQEMGFPGLNTAGRYLGVGWSHHTYHSRVDGRLNAISNRHPASSYSSSSLDFMYSPGYTNFPNRACSQADSSLWNAPAVVENGLGSMPTKSIVDPKQSLPSSPKLAPEQNRKAEELAAPKPIKPVEPPKPKEPPPNWLKPYLDGEKAKAESDEIELEPSPNDSKSTSLLLPNRYR